MDIFVTEIMSIDVICIDPETKLLDAIQTMLECKYSCMIIVKDKLPLGIITERDIVRLMAEFFSNTLTSSVLVMDVMSVPVITVTEQASLFDALVITMAQKIRHLPVVDREGHILGLLTQTDLAKAHFRIFEKQREVIESSVSSRTRELQQANSQLRELCMIDHLMGLGNRRAMEVDLNHTHALALRHQRSYAVVLFDVDFFKLYNDTSGHPAGDEALRQVASYLTSCIRKSDRLYRYGGEEILLLLPESSPHGAYILASRIIEGLADLKIPHPASPLAIVTMSCGVACQTTEPPHASWQDVVCLADSALYAAKRSGRNRAHAAPL
jgi:diguanylate cyclase (GGDEF)-like protein